MVPDLLPDDPGNFYQTVSALLVASLVAAVIELRVVLRRSSTWPLVYKLSFTSIVVGLATLAAVSINAAVILPLAGLLVDAWRKPREPAVGIDTGADIHASGRKQSAHGRHANSEAPTWAVVALVIAAIFARARNRD